MSFCEVHWSSKVLGRAVSTYVLLPDTGMPPYPVYYLLHGLSDDHTIWHRRTRIEWYVRERPMIVVMPDGGRGFYTRHASGPDCAAHVAEELPAFIERNFPADARREARCIGGLSMGGYGAMRLALGYPDRYVSANSHSGALMVGSRPPADGVVPVEERKKIFGDDPRGTDHDLAALAERCAKAGILPRLRLDCGTEDFLLENNRTFHETLNRLNVPHEYQEFPGAHNWDYWDLHVREALAFHCREMGIGK